ncbi:MAG: 23S rRNA (adenine(2503)-C(2))-methyltransferase RlmN [Gammaproteobacteria bacterium AqS3]|nr:23S rRNA (adenine(2503)-C(2))-methyltransferase RlmN [Gammaproteobacteria bacterium AqS3]
MLASDSPPGRLNLLGCTQARLARLMQEWGQPKWRSGVLVQWMHQRGVLDFGQMTDLPKTLRAQLAERCCAKAPQVERVLNASDGVRKWLIRADDSLIEAVLIPEGSRRTLCVSSQVGCGLNCSFCATGMQGFARNLSSDEIIGQVWLVQRELERIGERVSNVVMMGMGEPLLNFEAVTDAMDLMQSDHAYGISKQRVTLSTSGLVPQINRLGEIGCEVSLALSLHAPDDELRNQLVPINRKYPIAELLASAHRYVRTQKGRRTVTIEYILLGGVNDAPGQAERLAARLRDLPCKVNLIPYNAVDGLPYRAPGEREAAVFQNILRGQGLVVTLRRPRGADIDAACGQLAGSVREITRRQARAAASGRVS